MIFILIVLSVLSDMIYIQARRAGSRRAPFLCSFLVHHTLVHQRGPKKWPKGTRHGPPKRRQRPELFWVAKRTPKEHQNEHQELTKAPKMAPRGAKMRLKGGQICPTNSFKARRVFETAPGPVLCRQKGPKRDPKGTQNGVQKRSHFQTLSCSNLGPLLAPVGDPKWNQFETQQHGEDEGKDDMRERKNDGKTLEKQHI
jgi:hypothetical protein